VAPGVEAPPAEAPVVSEALAEPPSTSAALEAPPAPVADAAPAAPELAPEVAVAAPPARAPQPAPVPLSEYERKVRWVVGIGTVVRVLWVLAIHRPIDFDYSDMHGYIERAQHLADPNFFSGKYEWYYPSGASTFLSLFLRVFGAPGGWTMAAFAQGLMSGAEIWLLFLAVRRFLSERVAFWSAVLFATHYLAISYAGYFLSENWLSIGLLTACAAFVPDKPLRCLASGLLLGLGAWAKSQAFLLAPLWALWLLWHRKWLSAGLVMAGALAVVVPVSIFVSVRTGQPSFISNNGGQTFALAHCPIKEIAYSDPVSHTGAGFTLPVLNQRAERGEREGSWQVARYTEPFFHSGYYMHEGVECIKRYPRHALKMVGLHLVDTFAGLPWSSVMPWPDSHVGRAWWIPGTSLKWNSPYRFMALYSNLYVSYLILPLALLGFWWRRRDAGVWLLALMPLASTLASAVLFHGDPRFREPYDFCLFIAAAAAVETWVLRRRAR
jgi:4-amino-4-deoxy-L-arabinose transferase-like glycosyltransferase